MGRILLVSDMQNDFINGPLGAPEAEVIVGRAVLETMRMCQIEIV